MEGVSPLSKVLVRRPPAPTQTLLCLVLPSTVPSVYSPPLSGRDIE